MPPLVVACLTDSSLTLLSLRCPFRLSQTVRAVAKELAVLEPAVRVHEAGATARLTALHARLKLVLDDRNVELEPEMDIEAQDMITKMNHLIQAAQANVFKGVIKGPQEYAEEARRLEREARYREIKEALALKWEIEDMRRKKSKSAPSTDDSKPSSSKPRTHKKRKNAEPEVLVVKQKPAGFGSKRYEAILLADPKLKARDAKRRRAAGLATQVQESEEEEEHEMDDEEDEEHEGSTGDEDDPNFITPKRSKTAPAKHAVWPAGAVTPSTAEGAAAASASASLPRDPTFAPQQNRQTRSVDRPRSSRARALEPTLRNLPVEDASQQATQPMDDGETPAIFITVAAQRRAEKAAAAAASAAAESPLLISKRANMAAPEYIAKKLPTPARGASAAAAAASLPLPNAALLVANSQAGLFSLEDEAVVDSAAARRKIRQMQLAASASDAGKSKSMENQTPRRKQNQAASAAAASQVDPFAFDL